MTFLVSRARPAGLAGGVACRSPSRNAGRAALGGLAGGVALPSGEESPPFASNRGGALAASGRSLARIAPCSWPWRCSLPRSPWRRSGPGITSRVGPEEPPDGGRGHASISVSSPCPRRVIGDSTAVGLPMPGACWRSAACPGRRFQGCHACSAGARRGTRRGVLSARPLYRDGDALADLPAASPLLWTRSRSGSPSCLWRSGPRPVCARPGVADENKGAGGGDLLGFLHLDQAEGLVARPSRAGRGGSDGVLGKGRRSAGGAAPSRPAS